MSRYWDIPQMWPGRRVFIVGGGNSLRGFDFERLRGESVIGVNSAFKYCPVDVVYWQDSRWFDWNHQALRHCPATKVTCRDFVPSKYPAATFTTRLVRHRTDIPFSLDKAILTGRNSGHGALNLAYHFGAAEVYLLGYDMQATSGTNNFHDDHKPLPAGTVPPYPKWVAELTEAAAVIAKTPMRVFNCNPSSALQCFPFVAIDEVLNDRAA